MRTTDTANVKTLFCLVQSIPSPKAEWFMQVANKSWYERITGQETRNKLTDNCQSLISL